MAKKPANAKTTEPETNTAAPAGGTSAPVVDAGAGPVAGLPSGDDGGTPAPGVSGDLGVSETTPEGEIIGSEPAATTAPAGASGAAENAATSSGETAGSPEQPIVPAAAAIVIPPFLDKNGKVRSLTADDVTRVLMIRNVKIDGVFLETGTTPWVPYDIAGVLEAFGAIED